MQQLGHLYETLWELLIMSLCGMYVTGEITHKHC